MRGIAGGLSRYLGQWSPPHSLVLVALRRLGSLQCTVGAILTVGVVKAVDAFYCIVCKLRICSNANEDGTGRRIRVALTLPFQQAR